LPKSWECCNIGAISSTIQFGLSNSAESAGNYRLLRITDIQDNNVEWKNVPFTNIGNEEAETYLLNVGDILFARTGATVGKSYLISDTPMQSVFASYLIRVKLLIVDPKYVKFFFESSSYWEQIIDKSVGIGQPNVNGTKLKGIVLPLPPLDEQRRIVYAIESTFAVIDEIEQNKNDLQTAVAVAKRKILSLAIRGKLVPQDPNDEPASVLLERIQTEREALIKAGKIKRSKIDSIIKKCDDNSYYENLPKEWILSRIEDLFIINPRNVVEDSTNVSFIPMTLIEEGFSNHFCFHERVWKDVKTGFTHFQDGDVGLAKITPCLENRKSVVFRGLLNGVGAGTTELHVFRAFYENSIHPDYLLWFIKSDYFINSCVGAFSGAVGQQRISRDHVAKTIIPLPPLKEQIRIIAFIESAFVVIDKIIAGLS